MTLSLTLLALAISPSFMPQRRPARAAVSPTLSGIVGLALIPGGFLCAFASLFSDLLVGYAGGFLACAVGFTLALNSITRPRP